MKTNNILYHGSTVEVLKPSSSYGRTDLDFGPGFYLSNNRLQAEKWANTKASRHKNSVAVLNIYTFDEQLFESSGTNYRKRIFEAYNIDWLDFVAASRKGKQPWHDIDWIEGGIANDNVISTVDAYVDGFITAEQAIDKLINEDLRHQVCIQQQEIIDKFLHFKESVVL